MKGQRVGVPAGLAVAPKDLGAPPRVYAARTLTDLRRYSLPPRAGHFVAMEFPEVFATELREFFRELR